MPRTTTAQHLFPTRISHTPDLTFASFPTEEADRLVVSWPHASRVLQPGPWQRWRHTKGPAPPVAANNTRDHKALAVLSLSCPPHWILSRSSLHAVLEREVFVVLHLERTRGKKNKPGEQSWILSSLLPKFLTCLREFQSLLDRLGRRSSPNEKFYQILSFI